jgi:cytochrome P450
VDVVSAFQQLRTPEGRIDPYPAYAALHRHGTLFVMEGFSPVVVGYSVADQLLRDPRIMVDDAAMLDRAVPGWREHPALVALSSSILSLNGPDHTRVRRLAASAFTPRRVAELRDAVEAQADALVDDLAKATDDGSVADFMATFAFPLPVGIICALLGVPVSDRDWLRPHAERLTAAQEMQPGTLEAADGAALELREYLSALVAERRARPQDDFTTALVEAQEADGDRLSDDELIANLILLFVAGYETVTNLLGNGLTILLNHPERADKLRSDAALAPAYVEELLRIDAPVQVTSRWATDDVEIDGKTIPRHTIVLLLLGAANRDPARFPDPDRFDPDRPNNRALAFGAGPHFCLGAALARLEAQVAFPLLLRRLPGLALAAAPTVRRDRLATRGYATVPVTVSHP